MSADSGFFFPAGSSFRDQLEHVIQLEESGPKRDKKMGNEHGGCGVKHCITIRYPHVARSCDRRRIKST